MPLLEPSSSLQAENNLKSPLDLAMTLRKTQESTLLITYLSWTQLWPIYGQSSRVPQVGFSGHHAVISKLGCNWSHILLHHKKGFGSKSIRVEMIWYYRMRATTIFRVHVAHWADPSFCSPQLTLAYAASSLAWSGLVNRANVSVVTAAQDSNTWLSGHKSRAPAPGHHTTLGQNAQVT